MEGLEELQRKLRALGSDSKAKVIARKSSSEAMKLLKEQAKSNAKTATKSNNIAKNIGYKPLKINKKGAVMVSMGVYKGSDFWSMHKKMIRGGKKVKNPNYKPNIGQTPYWWFIELGTKGRKATPFLRPALDQKSEQAIKIFIKKFNDLLDLELGRR